MIISTWVIPGKNYPIPQISVFIMETREGTSLMTLSQDLVPRISAYTGYLIDALCSSSPCFVTSTGLHAFWLSGGFTHWEVLAGERYQKMSLLTHSPLHSTGQLRPPKAHHSFQEMCPIWLPLHVLVTTSCPGKAPYNYQAQGTALSLVGFFNPGRNFVSGPFVELCLNCPV